jgi:hypothetical protein
VFTGVRVALTAACALGVSRCVLRPGVDGHVRSLPRGDKLVASIAWLEKRLSEAPVLTEERADEILELMELK